MCVCCKRAPLTLYVFSPGSVEAVNILGGIFWNICKGVKDDTENHTHAWFRVRFRARVTLVKISAVSSLFLAIRNF